MTILQLARCNALLGCEEVRLDATDLFDSAHTSILCDEISKNPANLWNKNGRHESFMNII